MKKTPKQHQMWLQPAPQIIVSVRDQNGRSNAQSVGYAGNVSTEPDMIMVAISPTRFTHHIIKDTGCFVVNVPMTNFAKELYYIGSHSGRDEDKFASLDLNWQDGTVVNAPILTDCPINIECSVYTSYQPGAYDLIIGKVEAVHVDEDYLAADGTLRYDKMDLISSIQSVKTVKRN